MANNEIVPKCFKGKIIKECIWPSDETDFSKIYIADHSFIPYTIYAVVELLMYEDHFSEEHPKDFLSIHVVRTSPNSPTNFFRYFNIPEMKKPKNINYARKIYLSLTAEVFLHGSYSISLIYNGKIRCSSIFYIKNKKAIPGGIQNTQRRRKLEQQIFISGTPKSGTTWLEKIINSNPEVLILHEANMLNVIDENSLKYQLESEKEKYYGCDFISWRPPLFETKDLCDFYQFTLARSILETFSQGYGASIAGERTPAHVHKYISMIRHWPSIKIIHIVRHPLDVIISWIFHESLMYKNGNKNLLLSTGFLERVLLYAKGDISSEDLISLDDIVTLEFEPLFQVWNQDQYIANRLGRRYKKNILIVRYEDLLEKFEEICMSIFRFIGVDLCESDISHIKEVSLFENYSEGRKRGEENPKSFFRKGVSKDYKNFLTSEMTSLCWDKLKYVAARFGYRIESATPGKAGSMQGS